MEECTCTVEEYLGAVDSQDFWNFTDEDATAA